jgi:ATP-binding cassette subfamily B protein
MQSFRHRLNDFFVITFRFQRALRFVWDAGPIWIVGNVVLLFIQGLLPMASLYMMKLLVDSVSNALAQPTAQRSFQSIFVYILLTGLVAVITAIVSHIGETFTRIQGQVVADYMNGILLTKAIDLDLEYYDNPLYQDTLHRAQKEASFRPIVILNSMTHIAQNTISLVGVIWLLLTFHWSIAPLLFLAALPGVIVRIAFSTVQFQLDRTLTPKERQSWYYYYLMVTTDFAKEVRIFGLGPTLISRYQKLRREIRGIIIRTDVSNSIWTTLAQLISVIIIYGIFGFIAYRTLQGNQTIGDLVMFFQAAQRGEGFLRGLLNGLTRLYENNLFLVNLYEFLNLKKKITEPAQIQEVPVPIQQEIRFENVSFHYPTNPSRTVLKDINITIKRGEVIALVGENGSGKTTLVKLLCRLYDPTSGRLTLDGKDFREFSPEELRREIGVIFQDYAHYNSSAADNIWFGGVHRPREEELISSAARLSDINDYLRSLKNGYETILGTMFTEGQELSIGQWQKMAIARAFFRDSQMIILDEPTSALDPNAEYELFMKFRELLNDRTAILISHRMSTVRMADRIYVIQDGSIIEHGSHEKLVTDNGIYAKFFEQQAQNYR